MITGIDKFLLIFYLFSVSKSLIFRFRSRPAVFWGTILLICLLSDGRTNLIVKFFQNTYFLKQCGKYSFGMYLLHPAGINFINRFVYLRSMHLRIVSCILFVFFLGFLLYHLLEKHLISLANFICKKLDSNELITNYVPQILDNNVPGIFKKNSRMLNNIFLIVKEKISKMKALYLNFKIFQ